MNVKTGDLAMILRGASGSATLHAGKVVEVLEMQRAKSVFGPIWWVQLSAPTMAVSYSGRGVALGVAGFSTKIGCADAWLKKLEEPGDDVADESAAWLPLVPSTEKAAA